MVNSVVKRDNSVHSVDRAISVLQVLARRGPSAVTEIATELGVHKSTVFRLLGTLDSRGLVDQNTSRGRYQLGYGVVQLAAGATRRLDLSVVSRPIKGDAPTIDLVVGYNRANASPILKLFLSRLDDLIARVSKKFDELSA